MLHDHLVGGGAVAVAVHGLDALDLAGDLGEPGGQGRDRLGLGLGDAVHFLADDALRGGDLAVGEVAVLVEAVAEVGEEVDVVGEAAGVVAVGQLDQQGVRGQQRLSVLLPQVQGALGGGCLVEGLELGLGEGGEAVVEALFADPDELAGLVVGEEGGVEDAGAAVAAVVGVACAEGVAVGDERGEAVAGGG